jgi:CheY-like chemotaxis protein
VRLEQSALPDVLGHRVKPRRLHALSTGRTALSANILVVEDDALIRLGLMSLLEDEGFRSLGARDADEAIQQLKRHDDIQLVITDIDMPGTMDGVRLAHYVRSQWPPIKLVVISGKVGLSAVSLPAGARFASKPYQDRQMVSLVRDLLFTGAG